MKATLALAFAITLLANACTTQPKDLALTIRAPKAEQLLGTWTVDLRPKPDAPAYLKTLVVTAVDGNRFQGSFYDTPITDGRLNTDWGKLRIAFVTADSSGAYNHSAVLEGSQLEGLTLSTGRGFLAYWRASKP